MRYESIKRRFEVETGWSYETLRQTDGEGNVKEIHITRFKQGLLMILMRDRMDEQMFNAIKEASHLDFKDYTFKNVWQHSYSHPLHYNVDDQGSLH